LLGRRGPGVGNRPGFRGGRISGRWARVKKRPLKPTPQMTKAGASGEYDARAGGTPSPQNRHSKGRDQEGLLEGGAGLPKSGRARTGAKQTRDGAQARAGTGGTTGESRADQKTFLHVLLSAATGAINNRGGRHNIISQMGATKQKGAVSDEYLIHPGGRGTRTTDMSPKRPPPSLPQHKARGFIVKERGGRGGSPLAHVPGAVSKGVCAKGGRSGFKAGGGARSVQHWNSMASGTFQSKKRRGPI